MDFHMLAATFLLIFPGSALCLRCWVCGDDNSPHDTNPHSSSRKGGQQQQAGTDKSGLKGAWCSTSISNASCAGDLGGQETQCYKEMWSVDGKDLVKRGCARRDTRYNRTGCEEQMTGQGNFGVVLCLCNGNLCNSAERSIKLESAVFLFNLSIICLWAMTVGTM